MARLLNFGFGTRLLGFGFLASDLALRGGLVLLGFALFLQVTTVEDDADQLLDDADGTLDRPKPTTVRSPR